MFEHPLTSCGDEVEALALNEDRVCESASFTSVDGNRLVCHNKVRYTDSTMKQRFSNS
jgi:hypothetical protein